MTPRRGCARFGVLLAIVLLQAPPAGAVGRGGPPDGARIPVRMFVGYSDEEELQVVASAVDPGQAEHGPLALLSGDHYWTRRAPDGIGRGRLDLWAWSPAGVDPRSQVLVFCRVVDPLVKLDPGLEGPAELTGPEYPVTATVRAVKSAWSRAEYQLKVDVGLIPGVQRVYLVNGRTGLWSARTFRVDVGQ